MSAFFLVELTIFDRAGIKEYVQCAPATVAQYGGKYLVRGGNVDVLEGQI